MRHGADPPAGGGGRHAGARQASRAACHPGNDDRPVFDPRDRRQGARPTHPLDGILERARKQGEELGLVGEQDVDLPLLEELGELVAPVLHAEGIRERQGDSSSCFVRQLHRLPEGVLGVGRVPQVPLEVGHLGTGDRIFRDVVGTEAVGGAEVGAEGAMGVGRDERESPTGRRPRWSEGALEANARRPHVVGEHGAQLVVAHPADVPGGAAERDHTHCSVGRGPARDLDRRWHRRVQTVGGVGVDELIAVLDDPKRRHLAVSHVREHVDERVAYGEHVHRPEASGQATAQDRPGRGGR